MCQVKEGKQEGGRKGEIKERRGEEGKGGKGRKKERRGEEGKGKDFSSNFFSRHRSHPVAFC